MSLTHNTLHSVFHAMLRLTGIKLRFKNLSTVLLYIKNEHKKPVPDFVSLPSLKLKSNITKTMFNDMSVYLINEKDKIGRAHV